MKKYKIAVIVGSLRRESYNLKTAKALIGMSPETLSMEILNIANLPMFNEDLEGNSTKRMGKIQRTDKSF